MIILDYISRLTAEPQLACNLECVKDLESNKVHEYCGPVKIVVVQQPKFEYQKKKFLAAALAYANVAVGAMAIAMTMHYAVRPGMEMDSKLHLIFGNFGLLFFSSFGMMNFHREYGASYGMKKNHVRWEHALFHLMGLAMACYSWFLGTAIETREPPTTTTTTTTTEPIKLQGYQPTTTTEATVPTTTPKAPREPNLNVDSHHAAVCRFGVICGVLCFFFGIIFTRYLTGHKKIAVHVLCSAFAYFWYIICAVSGQIQLDWSDEPPDKLHHFAALFQFSVVVTFSIIVWGCIVYAGEKCREAEALEKGKVRPVCLDEAVLKLDADKKTEEKKKNKERKRFLKKMGVKSKKKWVMQ